MKSNNQNFESFSLSEGGPFHKAIVKMRLSDKQGILVLVGLCNTWLPLLIITFFEGTLFSGTELPFLKDVAMQALSNKWFRKLEGASINNLFAT